MEISRKRHICCKCAYWMRERDNGRCGNNDSKLYNVFQNAQTSRLFKSCTYFKPL